MPTSAIISSVSCIGSIPTIGGVPDRNRRIPSRGHVLGTHGEDIGRAHPALDRLGEVCLVTFGDVRERRRAGAGVEVLVRAPDREVEAPGIRLDRHRSGRVAQVPQDESARVVRDAGERRGIREEAGPVRDVAQHHDSGLRPDRCAQGIGGHPRGAIDLDPAQAPAALGGDPGGQVAVRREVVGVHHDLDAAGVRRALRVEGRADRACTGAPSSSPRSRSARRPHRWPRVRRRRRYRRAAPSTTHPSRGSGARPTARRRIGSQPLCAAAQRPAERVPVEIHQRRLRADELVAERGKRVGGIQTVCLRGDRADRGVCVGAPGETVSWSSRDQLLRRGRRPRLRARRDRVQGLRGVAGDERRDGARSARCGAKGR